MTTGKHRNSCGLLLALALTWSLSAAPAFADEKPGAGTPADPHHPHTLKLLDAHNCASCHSSYSDLVASAVQGRDAAAHWVLRQSVHDGRKQLESTYLGLGVEPPSPALRAQLNLPAGVGLLVNFVDDDSPAASAGIRKHDVLHKLDDQLLTNLEQLITLLRMRGPGLEVSLTIIRAGQPLVLKAKLGQRKAKAAEDAAGAALRYLGALPHLSRVFGRTITTGPLLADDGQRLIVYTPSDTEPWLAVFDRQTGKAIFQGPVATDEQWQAVPEEIRDTARRLREFSSKLIHGDDTMILPAQPEEQKKQ